jgi:hypothetical protein
VRSDEKDFPPSCFGILSNARRLQRESKKRKAVDMSGISSLSSFFNAFVLTLYAKSYIFKRAGIRKQGTMPSERALFA